MDMLIWRRLVSQSGSFEEEQTGLEVVWRPDMDVFELSDEFVLTLSLPGTTVEDVDVTLVGDSMIVSGERRFVIPEGAVAHLIECSRGRFERRVRLPTRAGGGGIRIEMADGQLTVRVPKVASRVVSAPVGMET